MKKIIGIFVALIFVLGINLALAHGNFNETKKLIDSEISCNELSDEQLEEIGDYYMEQMHPGESHELMHQMMGGEDSDTTRQMHTQMAKSIYCGETSSGMMGMMGGGMMNMMGGNMMSSGMMGGQNPQTNMMQGMMGNYGYGLGYWSFINILYIILLIGLIILVYLWIVKLLKNTKNKKR